MSIQSIQERLERKALSKLEELAISKFPPNYLYKSGLAYSGESVRLKGWIHKEGGNQAEVEVRFSSLDDVMSQLRKFFIQRNAEAFINNECSAFLAKLDTLETKTEELQSEIDNLRG